MLTFSIIIPVYNKSGTLQRCLSSIISQVGDDTEILAVDDGSTDGSLELLEAAEGAHGVRVLRRDTPGPGGYAARNLGAREARGEWLLFLDADDYVAPDHLEGFREVIEARGRWLDLIVSGHTKVAGRSRSASWLPAAAGFMGQDQVLSQLSISDFMHMNSVCVRRDRFLAMGGFPAGRFRRGGDVYTWVRLVLSVPGLYHTGPCHFLLGTG